MRIYAVGDMHGRVDLLDRLLGLITDDLTHQPTTRFTLIFLGDLIDRGPDSAAVVGRILRLMAERVPVRLVLGNHEQVLLDVLDGSAEALRFFEQIGGRETMASYGLPEDEAATLTEEERIARLQALVPADHVALFRAAETMIELGDYAFVHAGVEPGVALDQQVPEQLRWIRAPFLNSTRDHGRVIVHGHSMAEAIVSRDNRIGVDTGAYVSGVLSAVVLEGTSRRFLQTRPPEMNVAAA